jgi:hypothetical protein
MGANSITQASIVPSIFIGLGGTGSRIVDRIATRAMALPHWETHLSSLTQFVCLDTSASDFKLLKKVPPSNRILISAFDKQRAVSNYRESGNMKALQWLDKGYTPRPGVVDGAGQIRVESRLGFHFNSPLIREKLDELIRITLRADNPFRQTDPAQYFVYIYCGLGGGTGSGSFLTTSYLVQSIIRGLQWEPRVLGYFVLSTLMTKKVAPDLHQDIHANTYAALKELEHLTKLDYPETRIGHPEDEQHSQGEQFVYWNDERETALPTVKSRPFYLGLVIDRANHLELPDLEPVVGDASFLQVFSPILGRISAEVDNYDKHLQELTRTPGKLKGVGRGYTKHFGAFGVTALVLPAFELLEFCAFRFAAEALRQQITFGSSDASTAIDAKLADLRVTYDDPKFMRLSEGERQAAINRSFLLSMQAMASEDEKDGLLEGVWYKLVEDVDKGKSTGKDEQGKEHRSETLMERVIRLLDEDRSVILADVALPSPNLLPVQPESLGNYNDILNKFEATIAIANRKIEEGKDKLRSSAKQGDCVERLDPRLTPLQERYLVIRLLEHLDSVLIPEAQKKRTAAVAKSFSNPKVQEKFRSENITLLSEAAEAKKFGVMRDREAFQSVRDAMQQDFQATGTAQKSYYDAELKLAQYRSLRDYLDGRARQYANLATRMNIVVSDLERDADKVQSGLAIDQPRYALSVEVFETMDDPKRRLWGEVFDELFVRGGRGQTTFDRQSLAICIAEQLRPVQDKGTGKFVPKQDYVLERDLKGALTGLGRERLRPAIYGDQNQRGLTIESGIELEARICLRSGPDAMVREDEIERYTDRKLEAFRLLSGVYARLSLVDAQSLDDGVKLARTRNLVIQNTVLTPAFVQKVTRLLLRDGREPYITGWSPVADQHVAVSHDMDLPIPLYYFIPVVGEIEASYEKVAANPRRSYNLHIDYHWEQTLPNLNPAKDKLSTSWALNTLLEGLLYKVIQQQDQGWTWVERSEVLGGNLASALYRLGEYHRNPILQKSFDESLQKACQSVPAAEIAARTEKLLIYIKQTLLDVGLAAQKGSKTREDGLEEPIWLMFEEKLEARLQSDKAAGSENVENFTRSMARKLEL